MSIAIATTTSLSFDEALARTRAVLADQGFGVLTEIDIAATLKAKLGVELDPYVILGACNPSLAHQALSADPQIGLLLPCNVVVRRTGEQTTVEAMDPQLMVDVAGLASIQPVVDEARARLHTALDALGG
ncbi:MAG: DUF302 domain-containing protein [Actinomycetes bacterium]